MSILTRKWRYRLKTALRKSLLYPCNSFHFKIAHEFVPFKGTMSTCPNFFLPSILLFVSPKFIFTCICTVYIQFQQKETANRFYKWMFEMKRMGKNHFVRHTDMYWYNIEMKMRKMPRTFYGAWTLTFILTCILFIYCCFLWMLDEFPFMAYFYLFIARCLKVFVEAYKESVCVCVCAFECETIVPAPSVVQLWKTMCVTSIEVWREFETRMKVLDDGDGNKFYRRHYNFSSIYITAK